MIISCIIYQKPETEPETDPYYKKKLTKLQSLIRHLPSIFNKIFEIYNVILEQIKTNNPADFFEKICTQIQTNDTYYQIIINNIINNIPPNYIELSNGSKSNSNFFNRITQYFWSGLAYYTKQILDLKVYNITKITKILDSIEVIWTDITRKLYIFIMDMYTVQKMIQYSTETPTIYYSGNDHSINCKLLLEMYSYHEIKTDVSFKLEEHLAK